MRGVTCQPFPIYEALTFQLTRPMRGVTYDAIANYDRREISTHTPHAGRDAASAGAAAEDWTFQLTRPMRGVTSSPISPAHAKSFQLTRPMRGVTLDTGIYNGLKLFQLTRPMRGVTVSTTAPSALM